MCHVCSSVNTVWTTLKFLIFNFSPNQTLCQALLYLHSLVIQCFHVCWCLGYSNFIILNDILCCVCVSSSCKCSLNMVKRESTLSSFPSASTWLLTRLMLRLFVRVRACISFPLEWHATLNYIVTNICVYMSYSVLSHISDDCCSSVINNTQSLSKLMINLAETDYFCICR